MVTFLTGTEHLRQPKFRENRTGTYREIATSVMNERTNEPSNKRANKHTRVIRIPPGGGNKVERPNVVQIPLV